jgi:transcriptional regulator with XRE-family HTH domain
MQAFFSLARYGDGMTAKCNLRGLRETAGISQRELARQIGQDQSNIRYWENSGNLPRSDVLVPMAKALGVSVEALLGEPTPRRTGKPGGKAGAVFEAVAKLPRRQQQKILEVVEAFVAQHSKAA